MKLCWALLFLLPAPLANGGVCGDAKAQRAHRERPATTPRPGLADCSEFVLAASCSALLP
jgi:hypothetical protein